MSKRILLIHDSREVLLTYQELLELEEYNVVGVAENGQVGWELLEAMATVPDLIICNFMMPMMDGITLRKKLLASDKYAEIPFLLTSARTEAMPLKEAQLDRDHFMVEPLDVFALLERVAKLTT